VDRTQFPLLSLVISIAAHVALAAGLIAGAAMWKASQPKVIVVNLVPAIPALGTPKAPPSPGPARAAPAPVRPAPPPPRVVEEPPPRVSRPAPDLPARPPEPRLPEPRPAEPRPREVARESPPPPPAPMPPRDLPTRELAPRAVTPLDRPLPPPRPALPRPGDKEVPAIPRPEPPRPMPEFSRPAPPPPQAPPPPAREVAQPSSRGLPSGSPAGSGAVALRADGNFQANWYFQELLRRIEKKWQAPRDSVEGQHAIILFELARNGQVLHSEVKESSGNFMFDQAALRAVTESGPFRELPAELVEHGPPFRIHLNFEFNRQRG
jgi:TonB family protein